MNKILIGLAFSVLQCIAFAQEVTVASNEDIDPGKYITFMWDPQVNNEMEQGGIYFLDDLVVKSQLRDALRSELTQAGYTFDKTNADLVVNFILFDEAVIAKDAYTSLPSGLIHYKPEPGTLLISAVDSKDGQIVWQASANGLSKEEIIKDELIIPGIIAKIFQEAALAKK